MGVPFPSLVSRHSSWHRQAPQVFPSYLTHVWCLILSDLDPNKRNTQKEMKTWHKTLDVWIKTQGLVLDKLLKYTGQALIFPICHFEPNHSDLRRFALHLAFVRLQQVASAIRIYSSDLLVQRKQTKFYGANTEGSRFLQFDCTMTESHGFIYPLLPVRCLWRIHSWGVLYLWHH